MRRLTAPLLAVALLSACSSGGDPGRTAPSSGDQRFPEVVSAELSPTGDTFTARVTLSSPYDTPDRYADGWRVLAPDGTVLGEHVLAHDHASEQPFTRQQTGLEIPEGVETVTVEGRDQANGYGGQTVDVPVRR